MEGTRAAIASRAVSEVSQPTQAEPAAGGLSLSDRDVVATQLGRRPRAFRRIARRCPFGAPAVTEQHAYDERGEPFPTTYYLTCPHLCAALARLEAAGGVARWSKAAADDPVLASSLARATAEQRRIRHRLASEGATPDECRSLDLGIGGSRRPEQLKCLHAHAAFALARPGYTLGERILAEVLPLWPRDECCSARLLESRPAKTR